MPFYQQYNYIISLILIFSIALTISFIKKHSYAIVLTYFVIFLISFVLIIANFFYAVDLDEKSDNIIKEFKEFEIQENTPTQSVLLSRDFKLQPFSKKGIYFLGIDDLEREDIINIFSRNSTQENFKESLNKNNISFLLFYKDKQYNEIYYSTLMSFFGLDFSMDKFEQSSSLEKVYNGEKIIIFRNKK